MLPLNNLVCCSKAWTSLRSFSLSPRTRYIYREVPLFPAALSSSKSLVRAVNIAASLMRFISCFFFVLGQSPPSFWRPRRISAFIWYLSTSERIRRNSSSEILSSVSAVEIRSAIEFSFETARTRIWSCSLALASSFRKWISRQLPATHKQSPQLGGQRRLAPRLSSSILRHQMQLSPRWPLKARCRVRPRHWPPAGIFYRARLWSPIPFRDGIWPRPRADVGDCLQSSQVAGKVPSCLTITAVG